MSFPSVQKDKWIWNSTPIWGFGNPAQWHSLWDTQRCFCVLVHYIADADSWNDLHEVGKDPPIETENAFVHHNALNQWAHRRLLRVSKRCWKCNIEMTPAINTFLYSVLDWIGFTKALYKQLYLVLFVSLNKYEHTPTWSLINTNP